MSSPASPLRWALRILLPAVLAASAVPVVLVVGAALPFRAVAAALMLAVFVGAATRTLSWVAGVPTGQRANQLAVTTSLGAGTGAIVLAVVAVFAGPAVLILIPLITAATIATWWLLTM